MMTVEDIQAIQRQNLAATGPDFDLSKAWPWLAGAALLTAVIVWRKRR